jgi:CRISPR-associated protein Csb2
MRRVFASAYDEGDDRRTVEWPPHPNRLFSALVASWGEGGSEPELRAPLEWLEQQPPPAIHYSEYFPRDGVKVYVPINDSPLPPEDRSRKGRLFPSAGLAEPDVWFVWERDLPAEHRPKLEQLLRRTPSLGHSSSVVGIEISEEAPNGLKRLTPGSGRNAQRLRVPGPGRLADLATSHALFVENASKVHRPSRGRTALYARPSIETPSCRRSIFREMVVLRRVSGERAGLLSTLQLTSALRGALIALGPQPGPEAITGHSPGSTAERPAAGRGSHVALAPMATVRSLHATGDVSGLAILFPDGISDKDRDMVLDTVTLVRELRMPFGVWQVERATGEEPRVTLRPEVWSRRSRTWASVTPYVFDRYPRDPYSEEAQETVRQSFERIGLPRPASVSLMKASLLTGVPPAPAFPAAEARPGKPRRFHLHAVVTFSEEVEGPVIAGAGRFYGYGLFRPVGEEDR